MKRLILLLFLLQASLYASPKEAPVYRTLPDVPAQDTKALYSSKPQFPSQPPATLPQIIHSDSFFSAKVQSSCSKHGGINCLAGADKDGSVVCHDGFNAVPTRFNLSCTAAKLQILETRKIQDKGIQLIVRNLTSMKASKVKVNINIDNKKDSLSGPDEIDSFGSAEYVYVNGSTIDDSFLDKGKYIISCGNCAE